MSKRVDAAVQPDGSLYNLGWYLLWDPGSEEATLDGDFTAEDLRAIADHMDKPTIAPLIDASIHEIEEQN